MNREGAWCSVPLGAGIVSVNVPDEKGKLADVVLGYGNPSDYLADGPCAGKIPGRYAGRIAKGKFAIDGIDYQLAINNGPNALHGGPTGFQNRVWSVVEIAADKVVFSYTSADGEEGYPGELTVKAVYSWSNDNTLTLKISAETTKPTVVNLTNHAYFNLDGHDAGSIRDHSLMIDASYWLPTDDTQIPTGEIASVEGTPMDFRSLKTIGRDMGQDFEALRIGKGYDNVWIADKKPHELAHVLTLRADKSDRQLDVYTTQPAVVIYTGNWLEGCPKSKSGTEYHDYDGVAIECQGYPDAPNHTNFPTTELRPGEAFNEEVIYKFSTFKKD